MRKEKIFSNYLWGQGEKEQIPMPLSLAEFYDAQGIDVPIAKCTSFYPFIKAFREGWHDAHDGNGHIVAERKGKDFDTVLTYDGKEIFVAKVNKAGSFQHYSDFKYASYLKGKSLGSPLMIAAYVYLLHNGKEIEREIYIALMKEAANYNITVSDLIYRLFNNLYTFDNMSDTKYPFLTKSMLVDFVEENGIDISDMPICQAAKPKRRRRKTDARSSKVEEKATTITDEVVADEVKKPKKDTPREEWEKLRDEYNLNLTFSEEEELLVPSWDKKWIVTDTLRNALKSVAFVGKTLLIYGPAGTGKSTISAQMACILGLPYRFFVCSEKTDESNLLVSIIPSDEDGKQFDFVESELIKGIRTPSLVEIQEPTVIAKAGVLVTLNSLLDDNEKIKTATGEMVTRCPESVIVLTTNISYNGCRSMNQSVLSRMDGVIALSDISKKELVDRATKLENPKNDSTREKQITQMAEYFLKIRKYLKENGICDDAGGDGIIDPRGFVSWVRAYLNTDLDLRESCRLTIVARTSLMDIEEQDETWKSCILPLIPEEI